MAFAHPNQRRIFVPHPYFLDQRGMILPPMLPPPPLPPPPPFFTFGPRMDPQTWLRIDRQRTLMLLQFMANEGLEPSLEQDARRRDVLAQLKQIVMAWIRKVAWRRRLPKELISSTAATVLPYGSFGLGTFQGVLRCVKLWARRRGLYSHLLGFFGGIHLAILVAYVCQRHPNASMNLLMPIFFDCFSHWSWPKPVSLLDQSRPWRHPDSRSLIPIMMPCRPFDWCNSNITKSTFNKIGNEFKRGFIITREFEMVDFEWHGLFEPFPYRQSYENFLRIILTAPDDGTLRDWVGWVKSRFRSLLIKIETVQGFCDPNPTEYVDHKVGGPNVVFYWGLSPNGSNFIDADFVREDFMRSVNKDNYSDTSNNPCKLELSVVESDQLPKNMNLTVT